MKIIDLTRTITPDMPVYPGTKRPELIKTCTLEAEGFRETELRMFSHTGTHMDSPAHLFPEGKTLDDFEPDYFYGPATVLDVSAIRGEISAEYLAKYRQVLEEVDFLLLYTGWEKLWGREEYFNGFPVLSQAAARLLVQSGLKAIGVDAVSVDAVEPGSKFPVHRVFLSNNILIIENLKNLQHLVDRPLILCCLPLKTQGADGAPARAVGIVKG